MNWSFWIASRLQDAQDKSFTKVIVRLGVWTVAVSLCILLMTSFLIRGFQNEITEKVFNFWGHIHITHVSSNRSIDAIPIQNDQASMESFLSIESVAFKDESGDSRTTKGGVRDGYPFIHYSGILSTKDAFDGVICRGVNTQFDWVTFGSYMIKGDLLQVDSSSPKREIILSQIIANRLQIDVGEALLLNFIRDGRQVKRRMQVAGIYETGLGEYDDRFVMIDMRWLQDVLDWSSDQVSGYALLVDDLEDAPYINEFIYLELLPAELYSESVRTKFPGIFEWLDLQQINEVVLVVILLVVVFFNLSTVLIILILERSRMIGVLKSLGARTRSVIQIFIGLMSRILIRGFIIGNVLALIFAFVQDRYQVIRLNQADYYLSYAPVHIDPVRMIWMNAFAFVVIIIMMLVPALVISGIKPIKVLRFD